MRFQYYEVRPCIETVDAKGDRGIDSFRSEEEFEAALTETHVRSFWTVYGIDEEGLGIAIGDFTTQKDAHDILYAILAPMAEARDLIDDNVDIEHSSGVFITGPESASCLLTDVINQSSNMERI